MAQSLPVSIMALLEPWEWDEEVSEVFERNMEELQHLTGQEETGPRKSSALSASSRARIVEVLPHFIQADDGLLDFMIAQAMKYIEGEELRMKEWANLLADVRESYQGLTTTQLALGRKMSVFTTGFQPEEKVLDAMNSVVAAFTRVSAEVLDAEVALAELERLVPPGRDIGSDPLSKRLRGGNPVVRLGEMLAVAYVGTGRDINDPQERFKETFRSVYFLLTPSVEKPGDRVALPSESKTLAEINRRTRQRLEHASRK